MIFDTGLLYGSKAMAKELFRFLKDESLRERLSRNALAWAGELSRDRSAEEFLKAVARA